MKEKKKKPKKENKRKRHGKKKAALQAFLGLEGFTDYGLKASGGTYRARRLQISFRLIFPERPTRKGYISGATSTARTCWWILTAGQRIRPMRTS